MDIVEQQEKRQRLTLTSEMRALTLESLPHPILTEIASYLDDTLRTKSCTGRTTGGDTLLAVVLSASKSSWDKLQYDDTTDINKLLSPASKAVLLMHTDYWGERYEEFDFSHARSNAITVNPSAYTFPKVNLDDIDLKAILICIDARNNVKSLGLRECFNITGRGLEPLAGSSVIEKIDFSMVYGNNYDKFSFELEHISLCEGIVLPILHSIIEKDSSSLRLVHLPLKWRKGESSELSQFMEEYDRHLERLELTCQHEWEDEEGVKKKCENDCGMGMHTQGDRYGIQTATCDKCLKCFCTEDDCEEPNFDYCPHCQKYHCSDCNFVYDCHGNECHKSSCFQCHKVISCQVCYGAYCDECKGIGFCSECYKSICNDCELNYCSCCTEWFCEDCYDTSICDMCDKRTCNDSCGQMLGNGMFVCKDCYCEK